MSLKIEFRCSCGKELTIGGSHVWNIEVEPCEHCLKNAYKEGYDESNDGGYDEGYSKGYEEGYKNKGGKMFKFEDNIKIAVIILLCTIAVIAHQSLISVNLYNQNRIIITEMVRLQTEIKTLQVDFGPVIYFLEEVIEMQKILDEK